MRSPERREVIRLLRSMHGSKSANELRSRRRHPWASTCRLGSPGSDEVANQDLGVGEQGAGFGSKQVDARMGWVGQRLVGLPGEEFASGHEPAGLLAQQPHIADDLVEPVIVRPGAHNGDPRRDEAVAAGQD
jgi:hypothetical protein